MFDETDPWLHLLELIKYRYYDVETEIFKELQRQIQQEIDKEILSFLSK